MATAAKAALKLAEKVAPVKAAVKAGVKRVAAAAGEIPAVKAIKLKRQRRAAYAEGLAAREATTARGIEKLKTEKDFVGTRWYRVDEATGELHPAKFSSTFTKGVRVQGAKAETLGGYGPVVPYNPYATPGGQRLLRAQVGENVYKGITRGIAAYQGYEAARSVGQTTSEFAHLRDQDASFGEYFGTAVSGTARTAGHLVSGGAALKAGTIFRGRYIGVGTILLTQLGTSLVQLDGALIANVSKQQRVRNDPFIKKSKNGTLILDVLEGRRDFASLSETERKAVQKELNSAEGRRFIKSFI